MVLLDSRDDHPVNCLSSCTDWSARLSGSLASLAFLRFTSAGAARGSDDAAAALSPVSLTGLLVKLQDDHPVHKMMLPRLLFVKEWIWVNVGSCFGVSLNAFGTPLM